MATTDTATGAVKMFKVPAANGLWTTAADLVRFALGWSTLLPAPLAEEAMRPQVRHSASLGIATGLGWQINEPSGAVARGGFGHGTAASLFVKLDSGKVHIALVNRNSAIGDVTTRFVALADS